VRQPLLIVLVAASLAGVTPSAAQRPRIGLVLSGEGRASTVDIGVIKALEQLRVPVDVIVGTNMGAVIGGSYASGTSAAEIEAAFEATEWNEFLADAPVPYYLSGLCAHASGSGLRCGDARGKSSLLTTPEVVSGRNLDLLLQTLIVRAPGWPARDFDRLPVAFRSIATDLVTFSPVVFTSGSLASALRPSLVSLDPVAIVETDGHTIGDVPGVTRSIAINAAREMGADVLIVVDVAQALDEPWRGPVNDREALLRSVLAELSRLQAEESFRRLAGDDVVIQPDTSNLEAGATEDAGTISGYVDAGFRAAVGEGALARLALGEEEYREWSDTLRSDR
jgi:NTE family protein